MQFLFVYSLLLNNFSLYVSTLLFFLLGQGHLETRSDGGDCDVDTTEVRTGKLRSTKSHQQKKYLQGCV